MPTLATYRNLMSAELAKTRLEFYDIQAMIADEFFYILGDGSIMDGVRLQAPDADAERAKEILAAPGPKILQSTDRPMGSSALIP